MNGTPLAASSTKAKANRTVTAVSQIRSVNRRAMAEAYYFFFGAGGVISRSWSRFSSSMR